VYAGTTVAGRGLSSLTVSVSVRVGEERLRAATDSTDVDVAAWLASTAQLTVVMFIGRQQSTRH
jgi:hypothetical protein